MTILSSLYKSMSGLQGFTKALDNLSNNIANLNTTGYKANDLFFQELQGNPDNNVGSDNSGLNLSFGQGVQVQGISTRFQEGDINQTGNDTDLAIQGEGFFVLRDGGESFYTRAGQFRLDEDRFLVDPKTGRRVASIDGEGNLGDINLGEQRTSLPIKSTEVDISGTFSQGAQAGTTFPPSDSEDSNIIELIDENGKIHEVDVLYTKLQANQWQVDFLDDRGSPLTDAHILEFSSLGTPLLSSQRAEIEFESFDIVENDVLETTFTPGESLAVTDGIIESTAATSFRLTEGQFITRDDQKISYNEGGIFNFDSEGFLIDSESGQRVAARTEEGVLEDFKISPDAGSTFEQTSSILISGSLQTDAAIGSTFPDTTVDGVEPISFDIVDDEGTSHTIELTLEKTQNDQWDINLSGPDGSTFSSIDPLNFIGGTVLSPPTREVTFTLDDTTFTFDLNFGGNGDDITTVSQTESIDTSTLTVEETEGDGTPLGLLESVEYDDHGFIYLNYSNGKQFQGSQLAIVERSGDVVSGVTFDFSATSMANIAQTDVPLSEVEVDGRTTGQLVSFNFGTDGLITYVYSNGDEVEGDHVALAMFKNLNDLESVGDAMFSAGEKSGLILGKADDGAFGQLQGNSIELSNVELSREFADIIIVQRGYQASSQVLNVTNELIEELYNSVRGR